MKETILSNCERNFILRAAHELKRLDGRKLEGFRNLKVHFGQDWGLCYVSLGETKVLTQVTCEIQEPKTTRPNEGLLFINVELSSMAAPNFESGRSSDLGVHLNRLLEKCIKDSRAVDLESLCMVAEEKVWVLRVDVNILNHDGSLVDCASISALAALAHFKRPDVTTDGVEITVHDVSERDPIPITLHHYPVCVSFALLNNSENIFADPTAVEERVSDASLTFGINAHREICCLHLGGLALTKPNIILMCSKRAAARAKEVVDIIKGVLKNDAEARQLKSPIGFVDSFEWNKITALSEDRLKIQLSKFGIKIQSFNTQDTAVKLEVDNFEINDLGDNCAELTALLKPNDDYNNQSNDVLPPHKKIQKKVNEKENKNIEKQVKFFGEGGPSKWEVDLKIPNPGTDSDSGSEVGKEPPIQLQSQPKQIESIELSGDSEEEIIILNSSDIGDPQSHSMKKSTFGNANKSERNNPIKNCQNSNLERPKRNKKKRGNKTKTKRFLC